MRFSKIENNGVACALVECGEPVLTDAQSALDLLVSAQYNLGVKNIILPREGVTEAFFRLSTGLAGEILQKFVNYGGRIAIVGDFSHETSKPLRDFIRESNRGKDVFFVATVQEAVEKLTR